MSNARQPAVDAAAPAPAPADRSRQARLGPAVAVLLLLLLVGGTSVSIAAGIGVGKAQARNAKEAFDVAADQVADSVGISVRRDADLVATGASAVGLAGGMTNAQLTRWYAAMRADTRYPGTVSLAYIQKVPVAQLAAFTRQVRADPPLGASMARYKPPSPGARPYYCLLRLAVSTAAARTTGAVIPTGLDLCAAPQADRYFTDGGTARFSVQTAASDPTKPPLNLKLSTAARAALLAAQRNSIYINAPVYRGGVVPTTAAGRRAAVTGWMTAWFNLQPLLRAASNDRQLSIRLAHLNPGSTSPDVVAFTDPAIDPEYTATVDVDADGPWTLTVTGDERTATYEPAALAVLIAAGGTLATVLTSVLIYVLAWSRRRALGMVQRRTAELRHQALHDKLTGLPNRALIVDRASQLLARGRRQQLPVAALFIDLDNFKDINDTLGHGAGDELLQAVAMRLIKTVRESDTVGRMGGDEFVVLTEAASLTAGPEVVAQRLIDVLQEPFHLGPAEAAYPVTASIGVAIGDRESATDLLRDADVALYQAKAAGKNGYTVFHQRMQDEVESRLGTEMDLRFALENDQFFLMYQPTFDIASVTPNGAEALLRWRHPTRGVVPPVDFIPLLESNGLIIPVGLWVLRDACRQGAVWRTAGYPTRVSVNVSARQLESDAFAADVAGALADSGLPADLLTIEITEATLMRDATATVDRLTALKALGLSLAIDDFGTGYSSLAYLRQFPVDILKIDRSFIATIAESYESTVLVHSLVQLGKTLGLEVVAEGVEDTTQLEHLQREQCDTGQGYLFSRPLTADHTHEFLAARSPSTAR
jgi:diguanylate cyclase (GGDEF)-like protein